MLTLLRVPKRKISHFVRLLPFLSTSTANTIMPSTTNNDAVENTSISTLKVYKCHEDIEFHNHCPKAAPTKEKLETICMVNNSSNVHSQYLIPILLDSGFFHCLIKRSSLLKRVKPKDLTDLEIVKTLSGQLFSKHVTTLCDGCLPKFKKNWQISQQQALVFDMTLADMTSSLLPIPE